MNGQVLTASQASAMQYVAERSRGGRLDPSLPVTVNLHPDRLIDGVLLLEQLGRDGRYRSQFETGTSNGGLTAHPGGARWEWERRMFGGAYDLAPAGERPVYAALNHRRRLVGGSCRFGSAHLRLRPDVVERTTFCYPDSVFDPSDFGVAERCGLVALAEVGQEDPLDDYIEAHVHGPVLLNRDVEAIVLDPCFRGTAVEGAARGLPVAVEWHGGFVIEVALLAAHTDYRGPSFVEVAGVLAVEGLLTPREVGEAARDGWYAEQTLKRVWHMLARFGMPGR